MQLRQEVLQVFSASKGRYGAPRIHQQLRQKGICIARKRVARLMCEIGLKARVARIYRRTPGITRFYAKHQNLLLEQGAPTRTDQQWVGDLTYIRVGRYWHYLSVVMDRHSRRILVWKLGAQKTAALTCKALRQALRDRKPGAGLIFHTDRGVEYGAHEVQNLLKEHGILSSMNRPGCCTDNGYMESFFHSLKADLDTATSVDDMDIPGFRLHSLKGRDKGRWSIRVNGNWRMTFEFQDGNAYILDYEDYH